MALTATVRKLLDTLDTLPEVARQVVLADHDSPGDDDLAAAADKVFLDHDHTEKKE